MIPVRVEVEKNIKNVVVKLYNKFILFSSRTDLKLHYMICSINIK